MSEIKKRYGHGGLVIGTIVVVIGLGALLEQFGILGEYEAGDFWPIILVIFGVFRLLGQPGLPSKVSGWLFIGAGGFLLLREFSILVVQWEVIWPILAIITGLYIVWAGFYRRGRHPAVGDDSADTVDEFAIFGGTETTNSSPDFRGGELLAVFGGCELDLSRAQIRENTVVINAHAFFGGVDIRVPREWKVSVKGMGILGGYEDKTHHLTAEEGAPAKQLIVRGLAFCGGVEIKD